MGDGVDEMTSFKDLPIEISIDILSRLPVKTLIRLSSVRKSWYSLIRNPSFIAKHLHCQSSTSYLLVIPEDLFSRSRCYILCDDDNFSEHATSKFPFQTESRSAEIVGSCNGLVCFSDRCPFRFGRTAFLWNPSIRRYKTVPPSCFAAQLSDWKRTYAVIGFGFCESADDYRVVRVVYFADESYNFVGKVKPEVEVYSLKTGSWRKIGAVVPRTAHSGSVAFVNNAVHWLAAIKAFSAFEVILAFDLQDELFREMMMPTKLLKGAGESSDSVRIKEYKGSVSLFVFRIRGDERCYVWWMREYGNAESWTKQFTIVPQGMVERPLGFTKSGKIILEKNDEKLVSYDPERKRFKDLGFNGSYGAQTTFTESLVLLDRAKAVYKGRGVVEQLV